MSVPVLGAVLTLSLTSAALSQGVVLLTAYSIGLAIPFLLAALGRRAGWQNSCETTPERVRLISMGTGVILIVVGIMLLTGTLEALARYGFFVDFGL